MRAMHSMRLATGAVLATCLAAPAAGETHTETIVAEQRTTVALRVAPAAAQAFLPSGWVVNAAPDGPNLSLIFMDRKLALTPDGKPLQAGVNRVLALSIPARNAASGEVRNLIVGGYSADPLGTPGAYKVYRPGTVTITRRERSDSVDGRLRTEVEEQWTAKGQDGATVDLRLAFTRGVPAFAAFEQKVHSGADPGFYRIYRGQQASETVRGAAAPDRARTLSLKGSGGALGRALDGSEQVVSVVSTPFYARRTYLP